MIRTVSTAKSMFARASHGGITFSAAAVLSAAIGAVTLSPTPATADVIWRNGQPIFESQRRVQRNIDRPRRTRSGDNRQYPKFLTGGARPSITPERTQIVSLTRSEPSGKIIIDTAGRRLYYTLGGNRAYEYPISVGRDGFRWTGNHKVTRVQSWPSWHPPAEMRKRQPGLPVKMEGGLRNPLGAKALYLGSTLYRIHGTNDPSTIGRAASSGCFRMMNKHVLHLATLAGVGTQVTVVSRYKGAPNQSLSNAGTEIRRQ